MKIKTSSLKYNLEKSSSITKAFFGKNGLKVYWWNQRLNFGDLLTPELFRLYQKTPIHYYPEYSDWVAVGSLLQMLPSSFRGNILGTGLIQSQFCELPNARFISVRGELTKKILGLPAQLPTGDLGLLADRLLLHRNTGRQVELGIIPHYVDKNHPWIQHIKSTYSDNCKIINVEASASNVTAEIATCNLIVSSSLHGIIVADSLGIPNVWLEMSDEIVGKGFKFRDYNSSIDFEQAMYTPNELMTLGAIETSCADKSHTKIKEKKKELDSLVRLYLT